MAHNIKYITYPSSVSQRAVSKKLDAFVAVEDAEEGAVGLPNPIRWIDYTCKNYVEAVEYIKSHDRGWYDCLAVKYKNGRRKLWLVKIEYHT
jgi:hypothetical protein